MPAVQQPAPAALTPGNRGCCGAISPYLETQILHCHYVEKWRIATGYHEALLCSTT